MSEPVEIQIFPFDEDLNPPAIRLPGETAAQSVMADPFEVRMRFTSQLQHLNASVNSSQKAAHYALKYRDMDEDLHSCILEQLERSSMNNRANIMYFIEHLCDMAQRESHLNFVRMMQQDILLVVDAVAPSDGTGAANVKVVRHVLAGLQQKSILLPKTVIEIEEGLKERDTAPGAHPALSPSPNADGLQATSYNPDSITRANGSSKLEKKLIEQRIEEDRERHKRTREGHWAIGQEGTEYAKMFDETSSTNSDDYREAGEEWEEREVAIEAVEKEEEEEGRKKKGE